MKLWAKQHTQVTDSVLDFTVGNDKYFDILLAAYDVRGSIAHTGMLNKVGLLTDEEYTAVHKELNNILNEIETGVFTIDETAEDIHSCIEGLLTERIGDAGKKIHTGRSRNDQVAVDIKLFLKDAVNSIKDDVVTLFDILQQLSEKYKDILFPGYTHMQVAMPSSFGLWFGAYAESLVDDMELLLAAYKVVDKNPLGSGAGYGSSFPLNREMTTELLGFASMNHNSVYAQMTRGKTEKIVAMALSSIAATLSKLSMDVCLYMCQNFGFISFPSHLTTGSSIMPHKKNPDVFELIRAKCNRLQSIPNELTLLVNNLPSGYHRDVQLTKEVLFPAFSTLKQCIAMACYMLPEVIVKSDILDDERYKYIFTVEKVNDLVNEGMSFRDAYRRVGNEVEQGLFTYSGTPQHTHEGSIGNLCTRQISEQMTAVANSIK